MKPAWLLLLVPAVVLGGLSVLLWLGKRSRSHTAVGIAELQALSEAEAKDLALKLLARPEVFETEPANAPFEYPELPADLVLLFSRFERVAAGEFRLARELVAPSERMPGFIRVGEDMMFTEIMVKPGDSRVFELGGEGPPEPPETEPSIWHELLQASGLKLSEAKALS